VWIDGEKRWVVVFEELVIREWFVVSGADNDGIDSSLYVLMGQDLRGVVLVVSVVSVEYMKLF
jgi:hypothetical protein